MENLINDDLDLSSSDNESNSESDNEGDNVSDNGSDSESDKDENFSSFLSTIYKRDGD